MISLIDLSFISVALGGVLLVVGSVIVDETIEAAQKSLEINQSEIESSFSIKLFNLFINNRTRWSSIWLSISILGCGSMFIGIYFIYLGALQKFPDTVWVYPFLMLFIPAGTVFFVVQKRRVISEVERELEARGDKTQSDYLEKESTSQDSSIDDRIVWSTEDLKTAKIRLGAFLAIITCISIVIILASPDKLTAFMLVFGAIGAILVCIFAGYALIVSSVEIRS